MSFPCHFRFSRVKSGTVGIFWVLMTLQGLFGIFILLKDMLMKRLLGFRVYYLCWIIWFSSLKVMICVGLMEAMFSLSSSVIWWYCRYVWSTSMWVCWDSIGTESGTVAFSQSSVFFFLGCYLKTQLWQWPGLQFGRKMPYVFESWWRCKAFIHQLQGFGFRYGAGEDAKHLFFTCRVAFQVWWYFFRSLGRHLPCVASIMEVFLHWHKPSHLSRRDLVLWSNFACATTLGFMEGEELQIVWGNLFATRKTSTTGKKTGLGMEFGDPALKETDIEEVMFS